MESKKLKILFVIEVCLFVFLALFLTISGITSKKVPQEVGNISQVAEYYSDQMIKNQIAEADKTMSSVYKQILPGDYVSESGEKFQFDYNGEDFQRNGKKGKYTLSVGEANENIVTIEISGEEKSYSFEFDASGDLVLTGQTGEKVILQVQ